MTASTDPEGIIQDRVDISQRAEVVDVKRRFGDFEIDTIIDKNHKGAIMTTNDRCTHLVLIRRLAGKEATPLASTAIEALLPYKDKIYTITADNGKEFARHVLLCPSVPLLGTWRKRKHEWTDTPIHPERYGLQRADRRDAC